MEDKRLCQAKLTVLSREEREFGGRKKWLWGLLYVPGEIRSTGTISANGSRDAIFVTREKRKNSKKKEKKGLRASRSLRKDKLVREEAKSNRGRNKKEHKMGRSDFLKP